MRPLKALSSSVGSKFLIAVTGLSLLLFLVAHLGGNLLFLLGPEAFNQYSHRLISNPLIYLAEAGLLAVFVVHVLKTTWTVASNRRARPHRYAVKVWAKTKSPRSRKSLSSTTMILTGTLTLLFVITHLMTFKFGTHYETSGGVRDLYRLQLEVFSSPAYVAFYLVC
ncbi:MAG: cytochrome B subunit, partial [Vicinamibacterales bacterium]